MAEVHSTLLELSKYYITKQVYISIIIRALLNIRICVCSGYMAPEYAMQGKYSFKSDVFSFGVLVLEIVSGQRNSCVQKEKKNVEELLTLVSKVYTRPLSILII